MLDWMGADSEHWADYYAVTVDRPAWRTVRLAIDRFREEDEASAARLRGDSGSVAPRYAVDLGCGAGRDTRELLRAGWRVLAVDREPAARTALEEAVEADLRAGLQIHIEDLATVAIPPCDMVNASLCLPFLAPEAFYPTWRRIVGALEPGARFAAMLFGDHDESASDPEMTCLSPDRTEAHLADFQIEHWSVEEDDRPTALGDPHHFHLVEFVARKRA
ncbi:MAG: class I SAM-dependent methyltransferase [Candidatus Limnocylindrales bacterium]|jgi:SAM-dependent methyltransferase